MRKDPVTPEVHRQVIERDRAAMIAVGMKQRIVCVAPVIDPRQSGRCWGRSTLDHVKDEPRMGVRAPSDPAHLATLCEGHTEAGARAGFQWNTANRPGIRVYLRDGAAAARAAVAADQQG